MLWPAGAHRPDQGAAMSASRPRLAGSRRRTGRRVLLALLGAGALLGSVSVPADVASACDSDTCVVPPSVVQTPLGPAEITATAANVVTVHLDPITPGVLVFGIPFALPPGPPNVPGYTRTSFATTGGLVTIDTVQIP